MAILGLTCLPNHVDLDLIFLQAVGGWCGHFQSLPAHLQVHVKPMPLLLLVCHLRCAGLLSTNNIETCKGHLAYIVANIIQFVIVFVENTGLL